MKKLHISQIDALFSNGSYPIEFLFFYKEGFSTKKIQNALKKLSKQFWPVFGEYKEGEIIFNRYRVEDFYVEETLDHDLDISILENTSREMISRYALGDLQKLFFLKVLRYKNGMILIPKLNHLAGDGYSYFYFMSTLAALAKSSLFPFKAAMAASVFKPNHSRTSLHDFALSEIQPPPAPPSTDMTVEDIEIPIQDVQTLSKEAASPDKVRISSNDILSAIVIKKLIDVQPDYWEEGIDLTIPIDVRRQIKEFGQRFFGNSILLHRIKFNKLRLVQSTLAEVAAQIRSSMPAVGTEYYIDYLKRLELIITEKRWQHFLPFDPKKGCLVTNLSRLPTARLDFGTGPPDLIFPLSIEKNSAGILRKNDNYILRIVY